MPDASEGEVDFSEAITRMRQRLNSIRNEINKKFGKKIFQIKKRVELANIEETYSGIYSISSSHSHNSLYRVDTRHVERSKGDVTIHIDGQWKISEVEPSIQTLPGILIGSLVVIFEKFSVDKEVDLLGKREEVINKLAPKLEMYS